MTEGELHFLRCNTKIKEDKMFCLNCGTQLPDDASFCLKCGKPQKTNVRTEEPQWETCEIKWEPKFSILSAGGHFWARAVGPRGVYSAGESQYFKTNGFMSAVSFPAGKDCIAGQNALVERLVKDGWESTGGRGIEWYNDKFRRRVK